MLLVLLLSLPAVAQESAAGADACAVLAALDFGEAVGSAVTLRGELLPEADGLPARCRVSGTIAPEVRVETWLPLEGWNGKLLVTGCYGLCGSIRADQMEDAVVRGYATATTDGGHSDDKDPDSRWAYDNPQLETDFGHRAVHVTTLLAKALLHAFYGEHEQRAYFRGCSTGGRQALVAAQRYPDDFDGIIAGAPFHQTLSVPYMIWADRANTAADGTPLLGEREARLLHAAALAACDSSDGLTDGIIGDPQHCDFSPESLACVAGGNSDCLSPEQVGAALKIYRGPPMGVGVRHSLGAAVGSELAWPRQLLGSDGQPPRFRSTGQDWLRYHAFEPDPPATRDAIEFDFERDPPRLAAAAGRVGFTPDLARFEASDGRLIVYHGWADESLQPSHTIEYWRRAVQENGGEAALGRFARLFMLPGVGHCGGGPGAGDVDYLAALERWVELDVAPDMLVATRTSDSRPVTARQPRFPPTGEVLLRRPLFPYPDIARYRGEGDPLDPASYRRAGPGASGGGAVL